MTSLLIVMLPVMSIIGHNYFYRSSLPSLLSFARLLSTLQTLLLASDVCVSVCVRARQEMSNSYPEKSSFKLG